MARPQIDNIIDFDDATAKRQFIDAVRTWKGQYKVKMKPSRDVRSNQQNKFYWATICTAFARYLNEQDYNVTTTEEAHEFLKARFLAVSVVNKESGEVLGRRVRSTTELDVSEFSDYCERCRAWLNDFFGIPIDDPSPSHRREVSNV